MADNSASATDNARSIAILHVIVGFLLVCFGIADCFNGSWLGIIGMGIWTGVWMLITGGLGIPGTRKEPSTSRNAFAGVFMGFSITSTVFGGIIIISYSISTAFSKETGAISVIILILGIIEFAIGIWAAVYLCLMKPCTCCATSAQQGQVMHITSSSYVMTQEPGGVPVAVPMQSGGSKVELQSVTPRVQERQPQMVLVPISGADGNQPQLVQAVPYGTMALSYQPQQIDMPPPYEEGQYVTQQNQQVGL